MRKVKFKSNFRLLIFRVRHNLTTRMDVSVDDMSDSERMKETLKRFLEEKGFSIEFNRALRGSSGLEHVFDIVATREGTILCFDVINPSEISVLSSLGKAIDVSYVQFFLLCKNVQSAKLPDILRDIDALEAIIYSDVEDLLRKLDNILAKTISLMPIQS